MSTGSGFATLSGTSADPTLSCGTSLASYSTCASSTALPTDSSLACYSSCSSVAAFSARTANPAIARVVDAGVDWISGVCGCFGGTGFAVFNADVHACILPSNLIEQPLGVQ